MIPHDTLFCYYQDEDLKGEPITGKFYTQELLKTKIPDFKLIDKIQNQKTEDDKKYVLVSSVGHPSENNEWMPWGDYLKLMRQKNKLNKT